MKKIFTLLFCLMSVFGFSSEIFQEWGTINNKAKPIEGAAKNPYRILTFDGGGIRGAFTAQIIAMLEEELHFLQYVDFFAGTSIGSVLAFGLAYGISPQDLIGFFKTRAQEIFTINSGIMEVLQLCAKYQTIPFKQVLKEIIPEDATLDTFDKKVMCVSFELYNSAYNNWTPAVIDNFDSFIAKKISVNDAILRSAAAPTYFSSYQGYVDGGMVANNPSMMALAAALDGNKGDRELSDIRLLSLGTGINTSYIQHDVDWGTVEWIVKPPFYPNTPQNPLIDLLFDSTVSAPHYQCSSILGQAYLRVNPYLSANIDLDDWTQVDALIEEAKKFPINAPEKWANIVNWIKQNFLP